MVVGPLAGRALLKQHNHDPPLPARKQVLEASTCLHAAQTGHNPIYLSLQLKLRAVCVLHCRCAGHQLRLQCFGVLCCCCCLLCLHVCHLLQTLRVLQLGLQSGRSGKHAGQMVLVCKLLLLQHKQTEHMGRNCYLTRSFGKSSTVGNTVCAVDSCRQLGSQHSASQHNTSQHSTAHTCSSAFARLYFFTTLTMPTPPEPQLTVLCAAAAADIAANCSTVGTDQQLAGEKKPAGQLYMPGGGADSELWGAGGVPE